MRGSEINDVEKIMRKQYVSADELAIVVDKSRSWVYANCGPKKLFQKNPNLRKFHLKACLRALDDQTFESLEK